VTVATPALLRRAADIDLRFAATSVMA